MTASWKLKSEGVSAEEGGVSVEFRGGNVVGDGDGDGDGDSGGDAVRPSTSSWGCVEEDEAKENWIRSSAPQTMRQSRERI